MCGVFLKQVDLKPHRVAYWLNHTPPDADEFAVQVTTVCDLYQAAPHLHEQGVHVISTDEKTGIQALERAAPTLPLQPATAERAGRVERQE